MQHEVNTLEQCLYYYLAGESAKKLARLNIPHPIASIPPNYISQQPVTINFAQFTLQHFELVSTYSLGAWKKGKRSEWVPERHFYPRLPRAQLARWSSCLEPGHLEEEQTRRAQLPSRLGTSSRIPEVSWSSKLSLLRAQKANDPETRRQQ